MGDGLSSITMADILRRQLLSEAGRAAPQECCGLLLGNWPMIDAILPVQNVAAEPMSAFALDPAAHIRAEVAARAGGPTIIGYYHSHPNGRAEPSIRDAESAAPDGRVWLVIADDRITAWQAVAHGPWLGRFLPLDLAFVA